MFAFGHLLYILLSILTVLSNLATIIVFALSRSLKSKKYYLLISLAVTDMLVGMVTMPLYLHKQENKLAKGTVYFYLYGFQEILFPVSSVIHLAAISLERCYAVVKPLQHRARGKKYFMFTASFAWTIGVITAILGTFLPKMTSLFTVLPATILPLVIMAYCYLVIWRKMRNQALEFTWQAVPDRRRARDRSLFQTLLITTCLSIVTWLPFQILVYLIALCKETCDVKLHDTPGEIIRLIHYSNSLLNFVVYSLRMPEFRAVLLRMRPNRIGERNNLELQIRNIHAQFSGGSRSFQKGIHSLNISNARKHDRKDTGNPDRC